MNRNQSSFTYTALQLVPDCTNEIDHSLCWTFERSEGFAIDCVAQGDEYRWHVTFEVDGINILLDIHASNVIAVSVGPRATET